MFLCVKGNMDEYLIPFRSQILFENTWRTFLCVLSLFTMGSSILKFSCIHVFMSLLFIVFESKHNFGMVMAFFLQPLCLILNSSFFPDFYKMIFHSPFPLLQIQRTCRNLFLWTLLYILTLFFATKAKVSF